MSERESWMQFIREEYDPRPNLGLASYPAFDSEWDDGAGRIADAILAAEILAVRTERERCARIARNGCLVPPDGGSPTEAEVEMCEAIARHIDVIRDRPFYGAECPDYPDCKGGCGLGCTHEMERPSPAVSLMTPLARIDLICEQEELYTREEIITAIRRIVAEGSCPSPSVSRPSSNSEAK